MERKYENNSWLSLEDLFQTRSTTPQTTHKSDETESSDDIGGELRCGSVCHFQRWFSTDSAASSGRPLLDQRPSQFQWRWLKYRYPGLRHLKWAAKNPACVLVLLRENGEGAYVVGALRAPWPYSAESLFFLASEPNRWSFFANDGALHRSVLEATDLFVRFIPGQHIWNTSNLVLQIQDIFRLRQL